MGFFLFFVLETSKQGKMHGSTLNPEQKENQVGMLVGLLNKLIPVFKIFAL